MATPKTAGKKQATKPAMPIIPGDAGQEAPLVHDLNRYALKG
jgi:hypothetical protein